MVMTVEIAGSNYSSLSLKVNDYVLDNVIGLYEAELWGYMTEGHSASARSR